MGTRKTGKCLVCGKETTTLRPKCAKVGHDLFFCSPEHQKLVWNAHRRVCGLCLNPDARPWLSQREADEAIANLDVRRLCFDGRSLTLTEFLAETAKCPSYYAAPHIRDFTAGHHHPFSSLMSQSALADIRSMEIRRKCPVRDLNDILHEVDVFQALEAFCLGFLPCVPLGTKWYGGVQHRIVVLFSLLQQRKQGNVEVPFAYCRNAYELVEKYIAAEMDAKAADALISALRLLIDRQTMALKWLLPISCAS